MDNGESTSDTGMSEIVVSDAQNTASDIPLTVSDNSVVFAMKPSTKGDGLADDFAMLWWKNKLNMDGALYNAIEADSDGIFAVTAAYRPATAYITSFTYEGQTLAELAVAANNESLLPEKMNELLKVGDELKYGDALYKTGTPSGVHTPPTLFLNYI